MSLLVPLVGLASIMSEIGLPIQSVTRLPAHDIRTRWDCICRSDYHKVIDDFEKLQLGEGDLGR